jgi:putative endonuclease
MNYHHVYILASRRNGTLYTGVTIELKRRVWQHKNKEIEGFTSKYNVHMLVYFETFEDYWEAALRERRIKQWKRRWKLELIEKHNPQWKDLYDEI